MNTRTAIKEGRDRCPWCGAVFYKTAPVCNGEPCCIECNMQLWWLERLARARRDKRQGASHD